MENKDKVKVNIAGRNFYLTSEDSPEYLKNIAEKTDKTIKGLMNGGITFEMAAVLAALKYCDDCEKLSGKTNDRNLEKILVGYSKDLTRATARIKSLEKELAKLKKEQGVE